MNEIKLKRVAGPFDNIPFNNYIHSPVGLVPKVGNQTRLIFHLSYQFSKLGNDSLNGCTPAEICSVKYRDLYFVVKSCLKWASLVDGRKMIFFTKSDIKSAFKLISLGKKC